MENIFNDDWGFCQSNKLRKPTGCFMREKKQPKTKEEIKEKKKKFKQKQI